MPNIAIIGGGAAGFFAAVNAKTTYPQTTVTIFEKSNRVLAKVLISGGGRCNLTNSFAQVKDLKHVYPRGDKLIKRLFKVFDHHDTYRWFEEQGVPLVTIHIRSTRALVSSFNGHCYRSGHPVDTYYQTSQYRRFTYHALGNERTCYIETLFICSPLHQRATLLLQCSRQLAQRDQCRNGSRTIVDPCHNSPEETTQQYPSRQPLSPSLAVSLAESIARQRKTVG